MKNLLGYFGALIILTGVCLLVPVPVAVLLGESWVIPGFLGPAAACLAGGYLLWRFKRGAHLDRRRAFILTSVGWLLVAFIGEVPYILVHDASLIDGYFEAMSGFTTTGMSVFTPSELPRTLVLWRSLTEWIGGVGIILVLLVILAPSNVASKLYLAEARTDRVEPHIVETSRRIFYIYLYLTLLGILALYLAGASIFDAVNHSLTALPTGGFSPYDTSYTGMPAAIKVITAVLMLLGGISFIAHGMWMKRDFRGFLRNMELRVLLSLVLIFTGLLALDGLAPLDSLFQAVSAITTSGFASTDISALSDLSKSYLIIMMNIGGSYGATASGIKIIRFIIVVNAVRWFIKKITMPSRAVIPFKVQGKTFSSEEVFVVLLFCLLYITFLIPSILIFLKLGHSFMDSVFMICSAQGNNGLVTLTQYTDVEKLIMIFHMWIGRLEIIPVLILFTSLRR
ncbi:MAG: TrkH family potassium uptake protein [Euryarchaeota archaeon]|nr:TrkH family potassium uptake protein [Euryarchaeota archaeon]